MPCSIGFSQTFAALPRHRITEVANHVPASAVLTDWLWLGFDKFSYGCYSQWLPIAFAASAFTT
jgi:hypothetical protein